MKAGIKIKPFTVPNFVVLDLPSNTISHSVSVPISELDDKTLTDLCDNFRDAVFRKKYKPKL